MEDTVLSHLTSFYFSKTCVTTSIHRHGNKSNEQTETFLFSFSLDNKFISNERLEKKRFSKSNRKTRLNKREKKETFQVFLRFNRLIATGTNDG